jgi:hypothetical protein
LELNSTIFPILGPIGTLVNAIKVLVGGVFGIYLIMLYLRWREYVIVRGLLTEIKQDLHTIAAHQGINLEQAGEKKGKKIMDILAEKLRQKPTGK